MPYIKRLANEAAELASDRRGSATLSTALWFGGVALALAVLTAPLLQGGVEYYAQYRAFGIDQVRTGSVGDAKRFTYRKSVLSRDAKIICDPGSLKSCIAR
jgi:hypothetical protein